MNKIGLIKANTLKIASQSTIHGLPSIINAEYPGIRVFWIAIFCVAVSYSSFLTIQLLLNYVEYNVLINIEYVTDYDLDFPSVAICNLNRLTNSSLHDDFDSYMNQMELTNASLRQVVTNFQTIVFKRLF